MSRHPELFRQGFWSTLGWMGYWIRSRGERAARRRGREVQGQVEAVSRRVQERAERLREQSAAQARLHGLASEPPR